MAHRKPRRARALVVRLSVPILAASAVTAPAGAQSLSSYLGDVLVSSSSYVDPGFTAGSALPFAKTGTTSTVNANTGSAFCANATCSTNVWNNATVDANFGTTSNIFVQAVNATTGTVDSTVNVTGIAAASGINLNTSFASKSELALNLTPDGSSITFMAYNTTAGQLDVSNSNTPGVIEPGNTDIAASTYRAVAQLNLSTSALQVTTTNAYNGNNGRAAILGSNGYYYLVGNGGNGSGSTATTAGTGVQLLTPGANATPATPGTQQVGSYNVTQNGYAADKPPKDNNFRGETVFNNTLYVTKGSGSNGINTVYQVGPTGTLATSGATISVLPGFSTALAKPGDTTVFHPFGLFFANASTLYVADEGSGAATDFGATPTTNAGGLQKWSLVNGVWKLDYTLKGSLIGSSYTVNGTGSLAGYSLSTTTDGLRNLAGRVNADGTVTLFAVTSTEGSALGDSGADPNKLVAITDTLSATTAAQVSGEDFTTVQTAALGQVLRGVAVAPVPVPGAVWLLGSGLLGLVGVSRRRRVPAATPAG